MSVCYFVSYYPGAGDLDGFVGYYLEKHALLLLPFPGLRRLDVFTPAEADDPMLDEEDGPVLVAQMTFDAIADLEAAALSDARLAARADVGNFPPYDGPARHQALLNEPFPLADGNDDAAVIYHVQYHRPAPDEVGFINYYRDNHPPILAEFPKIRKVAIYTPLEWKDADFITRNDLMLINEVAFDSQEDLAASLESDVRMRAREDYHTFPEHGSVTHTPMRRHVFKP